MNILLIGSGGREHTLAWKMKQSSLCKQLFIAPGNAGTALCGTNLPIATTDFDKLSAACKEHAIDIILVGPEEPLVKGIYDFFQGKKGFEKLKVIGPSKNAAQLEGSKAFAKAFMKRQHPKNCYRSKPTLWPLRPQRRVKCVVSAHFIA